MSQAAASAVGEYMKYFVREAVWRAAESRKKVEAGKATAGGGMFVEVEDLEKVAPQLMLDF